MRIDDGSVSGAADAEVVRRPPVIDTRLFVRPKEKPEARLQLFCFPHAGGAASAYHRWGAALPAEVIAVQLPGREGRMNERPATSLGRLAIAIADAMQVDRLVRQTGRFAFFGHSMGALLAYETARALRRQGLRLPVHLFVSGRTAPDYIPDEPLLHGLDDDTFVDELDRRFGGLPAVVRNEPELMALFLPVLRADLTMLETHVYQPEPPLEVPLSAYAGAGDTRASLSLMNDWAAFSTAWRGARQFSGGHFFIHEASSLLLPALAGELDALSQLEAR